ncbi:hypothetical protein [Bacillus sp. 1P06AnD]|uniref:hypothetical protein n=1 Tax=Bacillus sp. 1P06AnD TaxID=3132208 RepID=UPI0039A050D1
MINRDISTLKQQMDNTILKRGNVGHAEKQRILKAALNGRLTKKRLFFSPQLSAVFLMGVCILIGGLIFTHYI